MHDREMRHDDAQGMHMREHECGSRGVSLEYGKSAEVTSIYYYHVIKLCMYNHLNDV